MNGTDAGNDEVLLNLCESLVMERPQYVDAVMAPIMMKRNYCASEMSVKGRVRDGNARRSPQ